MSADFAPACPPSPPSPRRALVIDDEPGVRVVLRRWLTRRGWEVDEAVDGAAAQLRLAPDPSGGTASFDLVICDLRMPALSGPELFQWAMERRRDLLGRIVFSSGDVRDPAAAAFLSMCGCPVLEKPFELSELARVIGAAVMQGEHAA